MIPDMDRRTSREDGRPWDARPPDARVRQRLRAGFVSLVAGSLLLGLKFLAWIATDSTAAFSDAMESIVNVVAALFALGAIVFAARPADANHPYGHGKMEFFTAVFEGGLVAFAAVMILSEGVTALVRGPEVRDPDTGMWMILGAGVGNLILGAYLVAAGKRTRSPALVADGKHVLADFWTSAGVVLGLLLVWLTGIVWIDPVVAILVGALLCVAGVRLVRQAAGGLLDEEDPALLEELASLFARIPVEGAIEIHETRAIRSGASVHVDAHVVVPEFWTVDRAHDAAEEMERWVLGQWDREGEILFHVDPCRRDYCARCPLADCAVRREPFVARPAVTRESIVGPPYAPGGGRALHRGASAPPAA
jgi:cation diffusion facilitator family transporter